MTSYIEAVNEIQREMAIPVDKVRQTYIRVRTGKLALAAAGPSLDTAAETLTSLSKRVGALEPPADAAELHRRLLAADRAQVAFAGEVAMLARYLPGLTRAERALGTAGSKLSADLRGTRDPARQSAAFAVFSAAVAKVTTSLSRLEAPATLEGARAAEAARTKELVDLAAELGEAIEAGDPALVSALLERFTQVARSGSGGIERSAVIAFNKRVSRITDLQVAVEKERARLDRELA